MNLYHTTSSGDEFWTGTLAEAHEIARPTGCDITLWDIHTDKAGVLRILNSQGGIGKLLRRWSITKRGGLHEESEVLPDGWQIRNPDIAPGAQTPAGATCAVHGPHAGLRCPQCNVYADDTDLDRVTAPTSTHWPQNRPAPGTKADKS